MPRNVEIKARVDDLAALQAKVAAIADSGSTAIAQDDTFFRCATGRLKLRSFSENQGELIFYQRSDATGPKTSFYRRTPTTDPKGLREALTMAHGATGRVVKQRLLFLIGRTRVHLDLVDGLGSFVELEVVLNDDEPAEVGEAEAHRLLTMLGIASTQLVATAYVDLLAATAPAAIANDEKARMLAGEPYNANDPQLLADRDRARARWMAFNASPADDASARRALLAALFRADFDPAIQPPFFCDYGFNIRIGTNAFFNVSCVFLDVMPITIGKNALLGPNVQLYTALHPMTVAGRRGGLESARPITIGDDVWIGGGAIVCPGVTIGNGAVIGAGSVVTRDVPARVFAAGNPCRVIRTIEEDEDLRRLMR